MSEKKMKRREFFKSTAVFGALVVGSTLLPKQALLNPVPELFAADADALKDVIKKITGGKKAKTGKVKLTAPKIAENGAVVPIKIDVESPMTAKDYVKSISILVDLNPTPLVATAKLTPELGAAHVSTRIRMGLTSPVRVFAVMSNGDVYTDTKSIKVTIGGCG